VRHHVVAQATKQPLNVAAPSPGARTANAPCGSSKVKAGRIAHVIWIVMENRSYSEVVKAPYISALSSQPFLLNSRDPSVKTIKDFKPSDHIAVPAVKVSVQAIMLQMAAAKAFGPKDFAKLDTQTVSMSPTDATIALSLS